MKFLVLLVLALGFEAQAALTVKLPSTMSSNSVQATLKGLLFEELQKNGPQTEAYRARLTGSYSEVTLEDDEAKIVCREHSAGILAVQMFGCDITLKNAPAQRTRKLELPITQNAGSVQATLKGILFEALNANLELNGEFGGAKLSGSYRHVVLEDRASKVVCVEQSAGILAVQTFGCSFEVK